MTDKRTKMQLDFDMAAHGWSFCNLPMLRGKVEQLRQIANELPVSDRRHARLAVIETALLRMEAEQ